jgi:hypothetical protein
MIQQYGVAAKVPNVRIFSWCDHRFQRVLCGVQSLLELVPELRDQLLRRDRRIPRTARHLKAHCRSALFKLLQHRVDIRAWDSRGFRQFITVERVPLKQRDIGACLVVPKPELVQQRDGVSHFASGASVSGPMITAHPGNERASEHGLQCSLDGDASHEFLGNKSIISSRLYNHYWHRSCGLPNRMGRWWRVSTWRLFLAQSYADISQINCCAEVRYPRGFAALFLAASIAHGLFWEHDPFGTDWLSTSFLTTTILALGTVSSMRGKDWS